MSRPTNGFKETELGPLPVEWEIARLGTVCEVFGGYAFKTKDYTKQGVPLIKIGNLQNGTVVLSSDNDCVPNEWLRKDKLQKYVLKRGDLLIALTGATTGKVAVMDSSLPVALLNQRVGKVSLIEETEAALEFVTYYVQNEVFQSSIQQGILRSAQGNVSPSQLEQIPIPLPPLSEQRGIARALNAVQREIAAQEQLITAAREVKRALMARLFTYGPGAESARTKETVIGEVPEHWEVVRLGKVTESSAFGPRFSSKLYDNSGNVATLRTTDLNLAGNINYSTMPRAKLDAKKFHNHFLLPGDFLVTRSGTCGIAAVFESYTIPVLAGAFLIRFRLKSDILPLFLREYFNSDLGRQRVLLLAQGAVQKNLSGTALSGLMIPLPPLPEQQQIARFLSAADRKIAAEEQRKAVLQAVFKSLLGELMTGRVRVREEVDV